MAPVLRTLTVSYSTDTIYALAISCGFLHLAFHDYSFANTASGRFQVSCEPVTGDWLHHVCRRFEPIVINRLV